MMQKGSKCKCKIENEEIYTKNDMYDEISMNSSQDNKELKFT